MLTLDLDFQGMRADSLHGSADGLEPPSPRSPRANSARGQLSCLSAMRVRLGDALVLASGFIASPREVPEPSLTVPALSSTNFKYFEQFFALSSSVSSTPLRALQQARIATAESLASRER